ncbi:MAG: hypothetical protein QNJ45_13595 [Ardenticatenaceae bacterium]|nr:hypothetical protein [Ardenticatenaceae bacterium]
MSQSSGFVPVDFELTGKLLLFLVFIGLVLESVSNLTGWFMLPSIVLYILLFLLPVSLYLIFVVPKEER